MCMFEVFGYNSQVDFFCFENLLILKHISFLSHPFEKTNKGKYYLAFCGVWSLVPSPLDRGYLVCKNASYSFIQFFVTLQVFNKGVMQFNPDQARTWSKLFARVIRRQH